VKQGRFASQPASSRRADTDSGIECGRLTLRFLVAVLWSIAPVRAFATSVVVETYWVPEGENQFSFFAGGKELCRFSGKAPPTKNSTTGRCAFELSAGTKELTVKGRYTRLVWNTRTNEEKPRTISGERTFALRDGSVLTNPLRNGSFTLLERWRRVVEAEGRLVGSCKGVAMVDLGTLASPSRVKAAEDRLGFLLPPAMSATGWAGTCTWPRPTSPAAIGSRRCRCTKNRSTRT
jgi:hypothetical protein